jgi:transcriptional regulator with XRE-family HTH domain
MNKFENDQQRLQSLAANVRRLMEAANLSIRDVSKGAKVPRSTLSHVLQQQHVPTFGHVCRLAEFFHKSVEELTAAVPMQNGTPNPNGETLTATGQARYNSGTMSTTLLAPKAKTIGQRIAQKRRELDMSQGDLAEKAKVRQATISDIETGRQHPTRATQFILAMALGIDPREISPTV